MVSVSGIFSNLGALDNISRRQFLDPFLLAGLSAAPYLGEALPVLGNVVCENPQEAARLARLATKIIASLIRVDADSQEARADDGVTKVSETTTTTRRESGPDGIKITKTTTNTSTTTIDPKKQAQQQRKFADSVETFGRELGEGKIQLGDQSVTFQDVKELFDILQILLGKVGEKEQHQHEEVIDMTEDKPPEDTKEGSI